MMQSHNFLIDGFLSSQLLISAASNQSVEVQELAGICVDLNRLSLKRLQEVPLNIGDPISVVPVLLVAQATTSFESALILASIGMEGEARTMIRRCIEAGIICCALVKKTKINVINCLINDTYNHYKKMLVNFQKSLNVSEENVFVVKLKNYFNSLTKLESNEKLDLNELAKASGIKHIYDTIFRYLSADASHTTLDSLRKVVAHNPENGIVIGMSIKPRLDDLGLTLLMAVISQLVAIGAIQINYPDVEIDKIIAAYTTKIRDLYKRMYPDWTDAFF